MSWPSLSGGRAGFLQDAWVRSLCEPWAHSLPTTWPRFELVAVADHDYRARISDRSWKRLVDSSITLWSGLEMDKWPFCGPSARIRIVLGRTAERTLPRRTRLLGLAIAPDEAGVGAIGVFRAGFRRDTFGWSPAPWCCYSMWPLVLTRSSLNTLCRTRCGRRRCRRGGCGGVRAALEAGRSLVPVGRHMRRRTLGGFDVAACRARSASAGHGWRSPLPRSSSSTHCSS